MKNLAVILLFMFFTNYIQAQQNLVYNGDFEIYDSCPNTFAEIESCTGWYSPSISTPDYFNACANSTTTPVNVPYSAGGFQIANSGSGYCGFIGYSSGTIPPDSSFLWIEYIQSELLLPLEKGKLYYASMYINLSNISYNTANSRFGMLFTDTPLLKMDATPYEVQPQILNTHFITDTLNWTFIDGYFIANGNEKYITIGIFYETEKIDTLIIEQAITPDFQSTYYLVDNTQLIEMPFSMPNVFTPNGDGINDVIDFSNMPNEWKAIVYNRWGNKIFESSLLNKIWNGTTMSGKKCTNGVYYYVIETDNNTLLKGFIQLFIN